MDRTGVRTLSDEFCGVSAISGYEEKKLAENAEFCCSKNHRSGQIQTALLILRSICIQIFLMFCYLIMSYWE